MEDKRIVLNRIKTPDGTILTSYNRHDYNTHVDKNGEEYMVDGGNNYLRRNINIEPYIEMSVYSDAPFTVLREVICRGGRGPKGDQPLTWVPLCNMSDSWVKACIDYNLEHGMDASYSSKMYREEMKYRKMKGITISE